MASASQPARVRRGVFRFAVYEMDADAGELRKFGTRIPLQQQPVQILIALLERPGEIVTREELRQLLWPADIFVDFEHSLNSAVKKLRRALNDDPDTPKFVETIPRRGYRFVAPVTRVDAREPVQKHAPEEALRHARVRWRSLVMVGLAMAAVTGVLLSVRFWPRKVLRGPIASVAVLPLQNLSGNPEQEYFADGLTDALITDLGKLGKVRVISRTSVMRYKRTNKPLSTIARELNVDSLVEGTILRSGNRVRITTQLLRAEPEEHLWAETYERELSDVLQLQDEVSRNIAMQMQSKFSSVPVTKGEPRLVSAEAYDSYLRGRFFFDKRVESAIQKAISYFQEAIAQDPNYAPAYSGLADCYTVGWAGELQDRAKGELYARKAIALQGDLAEAHASLGVARLYDFDLREAEKELKTAIELNPNYSMAHHWYALHFLTLGHMDEALRENDTARQLNPFSVPVNNARIMILVGLRRFDDALAQAETLREIEDNYASHLAKARIYRFKKMYSEALAEEQKSIALLGDKQRKSDFEEVFGTFKKMGYPAAARMWSELKVKHYLHPYSASEIAVAAVEAGNNDDAVKWLERAYEARDIGQFPLRSSPEFDALRGDTRFRELEARFEGPHSE